MKYIWRDGESKPKEGQYCILWYRHKAGATTLELGILEDGEWQLRRLGPAQGEVVGWLPIPEYEPGICPGCGKKIAAK